MASDLSRWMGAMSDLDMLEKEAKNPPIFKKLFAGKSVEQEAIETFAAKQKAQQQRYELQQWIGMTMGRSKWDELVRMEGPSVSNAKKPYTNKGNVGVSLLKLWHGY